MCNNNTEPEPGPSCPAPAAVARLSRNILLIFFPFKKKSFSFYTSPPRPPRTHKGDASSALLSSPCSARPRRFLLYPACLNDSSAFPFSKSPFSRARVDYVSFLLVAGVWAAGTLPRMRPRWPEPDHPPTHGAPAASVRGLEREQCKDPALSFLCSSRFILVVLEPGIWAALFASFVGNSASCSV